MVKAAEGAKLEEAEMEPEPACVSTWAVELAASAPDDFLSLSLIQYSDPRQR